MMLIIMDFPPSSLLMIEETPIKSSAWLIRIWMANHGIDIERCISYDEFNQLKWIHVESWRRQMQLLIGINKWHGTLWFSRGKCVLLPIFDRPLDDKLFAHWWLFFIFLLGIVVVAFLYALCVWHVCRFVRSPPPTVLYVELSVEMVQMKVWMLHWLHGDPIDYMCAFNYNFPKQH